VLSHFSIMPERFLLSLSFSFFGGGGGCLLAFVLHKVEEEEQFQTEKKSSICKVS
jgi:hypothetical protein